jgi:ParB-like chromosome segregation protein Spo0J
MPTADLHLDPKRFQYKIAWKDVGAEKWRPELAGVVSVWRDPKNGKTYVVNGHRRVAMAKRLGTESLDVRYLNVDTPDKARSLGALINIAEGHGTVMDAAKFFRDSGMTPEELKAQGVSLTDYMAAQGIALSRVSPGIWNAVGNGTMPVERAAIIGRGLPEHAQQDALVKLLKKRGNVTNGVLDELIQGVRQAAVSEERTEDLFGASTIRKSHALERAEVADYVRSGLIRTATTLKMVSQEQRADILKEAGNVLDTDKNKRLAGDAAAVAYLFDTFKNKAGDVASILTDAAKQLAEGGDKNGVKRETLKRVGEALRADVVRIGSRVPTGSAGRGGGDILPAEERPVRPDNLGHEERGGAGGEGQGGLERPGQRGMGEGDVSGRPEPLLTGQPLDRWQERDRLRQEAQHAKDVEEIRRVASRIADSIEQTNLNLGQAMGVMRLIREINGRVPGFSQFAMGMRWVAIPEKIDALRSRATRLLGPEEAERIIDSFSDITRIIRGFHVPGTDMLWFVPEKLNTELARHEGAHGRFDAMTERERQPYVDEAVERGRILVGIVRAQFADKAKSDIEYLTDIATKSPAGWYAAMYKYFVEPEGTLRLFDVADAAGLPPMHENALKALFAAGLADENGAFNGAVAKRITHEYVAYSSQMNDVFLGNLLAKKSTIASGRQGELPLAGRQEALFSQGQSPPSPAAKPGGENVVVTEAEKDAAVKRIAERGKTTLTSGPNPEDFADWVKVGVYHAERVGRNFVVWSKEMLKELGDGVKDSLKKIWAATTKQHDEMRAKAPPLSPEAQESLDDTARDYISRGKTQAEWAKDVLDFDDTYKPHLEKAWQDARRAEVEADIPKPEMDTRPSNWGEFGPGTLAERDGKRYRVAAVISSGTELQVTGLDGKNVQVIPLDGTRIVGNEYSPSDRTYRELVSAGHKLPRNEAEWKALAALVDQPGGLTRGEFSTLVHATKGFDEITGRGLSLDRQLTDTERDEVKTVIASGVRARSGMTPEQFDAANAQAYKQTMRFYANLSKTGEVKLPDDPAARRSFVRTLRQVGRQVGKGLRDKGVADALNKRPNRLASFAAVVASSRNALNSLEMRTGQTFRRSVDHMIEWSNEANKRILTSLDNRIKATGLKPWNTKLSVREANLIGNWLFDRPGESKDVHWKRILDADVARGKRGKDRVQKIAQVLHDFLQNEGAQEIKQVRFRNWMEQGEDAKPHDAKPESRAKGIEILATQGEDALKEWLKTVDMGARDYYYMGGEAQDIIGRMLSLAEPSETVKTPGPGAVSAVRPVGEKPRSPDAQRKPFEGNDIIGAVYRHVSTNAIANAAWNDVQKLRESAKSAELSGEDIKALDQIRKLATFRAGDSGVPNKVLRMMAQASRVWWTGYFADPTRMIWWTGRNMIQPLVFMPGQVPITTLLKYSAAAIKGKELPDDYHKFMETTFKNMVNQRMARAHYETGLDLVTGLGESRWGGGMHTAKQFFDHWIEWSQFSDQLGREISAAPSYLAAHDFASKFLSGKTTWSKMNAALFLENMPASEVASLKTRLMVDRDVAGFSSEYARIKTDNANFRYDTASRSQIEQHPLSQAIAGIYTYPRGAFEAIYRNGMKPLADGIRERNWSMMTQGLTSLVATVGASYGVSQLCAKILGRKDYDPKSLFGWGYTFLSPGFSTIVGITADVQEALRRGEYSNLSAEETAKTVWQQLSARSLDTSIPLATTFTSIYEAAGNKYGVRVMSLVRSMADADWRERYGEFKENDRNVYEGVAHMLWGGFERPAESEMSPERTWTDMREVYRNLYASDPDYAKEWWNNDDNVATREQLGKAANAPPPTIRAEKPADELTE